VTAGAKLAAFAVAGAAAFALGFGIGDAAGPFDDDREAPASESPATDHGMEHQ
jgi:hypothetical protein